MQKLTLVVNVRAFNQRPTDKKTRSLMSDLISCNRFIIRGKFASALFAFGLILSTASTNAKHAHSIKQKYRTYDLC